MKRFFQKLRGFFGNLTEKQIKKTAKYLFFIAVLIFLIVGLWRYGSLLGAISIAWWFVGKLENSGVNTWLAYALVIPFVIVLMFVVGWLFSRKRERRIRGIIVGSGVFFLWFIALFLIQKDILLFNRIGEPQKMYASTPWGYEEVPKGWSVHQKYGTTAVKMTKEIAMSMKVSKKGLPKLEKIEPTRDMVFFAPDGQPLVWYYEYPDGRIDLFPRPGAHPQIGVALNPIKPEIAIKIFRLIDEGGVVSSYEEGGFLISKPDDLKKLSDTLKRAKIK